MLFVSRSRVFHQLFTSISVANQAKGCVGVGGSTWAVSMDPCTVYTITGIDLHGTQTISQAIHFLHLKTMTII